MYRLIKHASVREVLVEQVPEFGASLFIAELFYKFHSFTLECLAFLATWYVVDLIVSSLGKRIWQRQVDRA